MTLSRPEKKVK